MAISRSQLRAYNARVEEIVREVKATLRGGDRVLLAVFERFRDRLLAVTATRPFRLHVLQRLREDVLESIIELQEVLNGRFQDQARELAALGTKSVILPLKGIVPDSAAASVIGITAPVALVAVQHSADLIVDIGSQLRKDINGIILRGITGELPEAEIRGQIAKRLGKAGKNVYANRAKTIFEHETMRVFSIAQQTTGETMTEQGADLVKVWRWSGKSRANHAAIDGQVREVNEPFDVPTPGTVAARPNPTDYSGGEKGMGPRWPSLSAGNSVNCGCTSQLVPREIAARLVEQQGARRFRATPVAGELAAGSRRLPAREEGSLFPGVTRSEKAANAILSASRKVADDLFANVTVR